MGPPTVLVVRETRSLALSVEELLRGAGYRLRSVPDIAAARRALAHGSASRYAATLVVCNQAICAGVAPLGDAGAAVPLLIVGCRGALGRGARVPRTAFLQLPVRAEVLLASLRSLTGTPPETSGACPSTSAATPTRS